MSKAMMAALALGLLITARGNAQGGPQNLPIPVPSKATPADSRKATPSVAVFDMNRVLKEYRKGSRETKQIAEKRKELQTNAGQLTVAKFKELTDALDAQEEHVLKQVYDDIKSVVEKAAILNDYDLVLAYPGADDSDPKAKVRAIKPTAAEPFFVARRVDITNVVIMTLNSWYPAPAEPASLNLKLQY